MRAALKASARPHQNVSRCAGAPQSLIGKPTLFVVRWSVIRDNDHQVEVTVRTVVAPGFRAKEIDVVGLVGFHQPLDDTYQSTPILCRQVRQPTAHLVYQFSL